MQCRIVELKWREVVNVCDGQRMGYVEDALLDTASGRIVALVVPGPCKFLGLFFPGDDYIIPWECVTRIGNDLILVEIHGDCRRGKRPRRPLF